jgi:LPXTG-site transpeptidase (sortase) family protein
MKKVIRTTVFILLSLLLIIPLQSVQAATPLYVRPGGSNVLCNGTVNVNYSAPVAPNCALATIQGGINLVDSGGTVNVAAGTYLESLNINKPLTLHSISGPPSTTLNGGDPYSVQIYSKNVTLDGFTITNPGYAGSSDASGIVVEPSGANAQIHITNNIIHDIGSPARTSVAYGNVGINIGGADGVEIDHNTIYNIVHNDPAAWANGISIWGMSPSALADHINIHNNVIYNISSSYFADAGISTQTDVGAVTVLDNRITNTGEFGLEVRSTNTVNAASNWWGNASGPAGVGPGTGSAITTNVDFDPWCSSDCSAPDTGVGSAGGSAVRDPWSVTVPPATIPDGSLVNVVNLNTSRPLITSPMQELERLSQITIDGPGGPLTAFNPALKICYHYSGADQAAGFDPSTAVIGTADVNGTSWTMLTTLPTTGQRICADTGHLSYFEVFYTPAVITGAALPATGFAPEQVTLLPPQRVSYAGLGDLWLEVPRLGVQMPIVGVPQTIGKWDVSWLGVQAGWLEGSTFPTWEGNSVLTGHVYDANGHPGPFRFIDTLRWGDQVIIHAWGAQYVYEVRSVKQISLANKTTLLKHEKLPWVTLVTCRGYDSASNSYKYRVLIRAVLVDVK